MISNPFISSAVAVIIVKQIVQIYDFTSAFLSVAVKRGEITESRCSNQLSD